MVKYNSNQSTWTFNRLPELGDVYIADFSLFTQHSSPLIKDPHMLVIIQSDQLLSNSPLRICVPITSFKPDKHLTENGKLRFPFHYVLKKQDYPFLDVDSLVKTEQIITIEWGKYLPDQNYLGSLNKGDLKEVLMKIGLVLGFKETLGHSRRRK